MHVLVARKGGRLHALLQKRNNGGQQLKDICEMEDLILCNTAFKHKISSQKQRGSHRAKMIGIKFTSNIICRHSLKGLLFNSKSHPATQYKSDNFLIIAQIAASRFCGRGHEVKKRKVAPKRVPPLNRELLVNSVSHQEQYENKVKQLLKTITREGKAGERWKAGIAVMQRVAKEVVGHVERRAKRVRFVDKELGQMSNRHKELRVELLNNKRIYANEEKLKQLKHKLNQVSHAREKRLRTLESEKLDKIASNVEQFHNGAKAFEAVKELKCTMPR